MPMLILAGAAYVAYQKQQSDALSVTDASINLEGKTCVEFFPLELKLGLFEAPISTATYFDGNYKVAVEHLQQRVAAIVHANPWLGGWLVKAPGDKDVKLWYDETGEQCAPGTFQVIEPEESLLTEDTSYAELGRDFDVKVQKTKGLVGKDQSLWRVTVMPLADKPEDRFCLVLSVSHIIADGHTFYKIYNMLSQGAPIETLNPVRHMEYPRAVSDRLGLVESEYVARAVTNPRWEWKRTEENPIEHLLFYVSEDWLNGLESTASAAVGGEDLKGQNTSKNCKLVSWFFNTVKPTVGLMAYDFRDRLPNCAVTDLDAGNYQNPIPYTECDYATPELIQHSLTSHKRCGSVPPTPIGFQWDSTFSVTSNWSTFQWERMNLGQGITEDVHFPLYNTNDLGNLPSKVSLMCLFTACSASVDGTRKRRVGASIVAPRDVIGEIESSGIVDEMIGKLGQEDQAKAVVVALEKPREVIGEIESSGIVDEMVGKRGQEDQAKAVVVEVEKQEESVEEGN